MLRSGNRRRRVIVTVDLSEATWDLPSISVNLAIALLISLPLIIVLAV